MIEQFSRQFPTNHERIVGRYPTAFTKQGDAVFRGQDGFDLENVAVQSGIGAGGEVTVAAQFGKERSLGVDSKARRRILNERQKFNERGCIAATFHRHCSLCHLGEHHRRIKKFDLPIREIDIQTIDRGRRHDDGIEVHRLRQAGGDVAAKISEAKIGTQMGELCATPDRTGGHNGTFGKFVEGGSDEEIAGIGPRGNSSNNKAVRGDGRHVFAGVHGDVGTTIENGSLHLLDEYPFATHGMNRDVEALIGSGLDQHLLDRQRHTGAGCNLNQGGGNSIGLPLGQRTGTSSGTDLQRLGGGHPSPLQLEQIAQGVGQSFALGRAGGVLDGDGRLMQQFGDDAVGERLNSFELTRIEITESGPETIQLGAAHGLTVGMQRGDKRRDFAGSTHCTEPLDLFVDDGVHRSNFAPAFSQTGFGETTKIIHIEQGDTGKLSRRRIDVSGHSDVDNQDRSTITGSHDPGEIRVLKDHGLSASTGHEEINFGQREIEIGETDRTTTETHRDLGSGIEGAIGDADIGDTVGGERPHHALTLPV